jgi:hypothetical protein
VSALPLAPVISVTDREATLQYGSSQMLFIATPEEEVMSGMCELIDTELDAVCGGHHRHHGHHGLFNFGNFGNIVIQENIAVQIGVAIGSIASVAQQLGQLNSSSIA